MSGRKKQLGPNGERYFSIFNTVAKSYQFGICELSPRKAMKKLFEMIGKDAYRWRFEVRQIGANHPYAQHYERVKPKRLKKEPASSANESGQKIN